MATAIFPGPIRPLPVPSRKARAYPSLSQGRAASREGDLTIHRITSTHHGRSLLTLGHAAEEHNGEIVPRSGWAETTVNGGDRLEVVHFVGGGSGYLNLALVIKRIDRQLECNT